MNKIITNRLTSCPKCQSKIPMLSNECPECGIIIHKYLKRQMQMFETKLQDENEPNTLHAEDLITNNLITQLSSKKKKLIFVSTIIVLVGSVSILLFLYYPLNKSEHCISGDCINGYGTFLYKDNFKHQGYYKDGKKHGKGIAYYPDEKKLYEGEYKDGKWHEGIEYNKNGTKIYEGQFVDNKWNGQGILYRENGTKLYEGQFKNRDMEGRGILYRENGTKLYEGQFKNGDMEGRGIGYYENGQKGYEGQFVDNTMNGQGVLYFEDGTKNYEGQFVDNTINGQGILYSENGQKLYEGQFINGVAELILHKNAERDAKNRLNRAIKEAEGYIPEEETTTWRDNNKFTAGTYSLNGNELEGKFDDGSSYKTKLEKRGDRYYNPDNGDYYKINNDGSLSVYDNQGLVDTFR